LATLRGRERADYVVGMFGRISGRYDLLNALMSGGRHHTWRRKALALALDGLKAEGPALDLAAGTLDFPLDAADWGEWVATDFSAPMLKIGVDKLHRANRVDRVGVALSDAHTLPFKDDSFALVTVGFGMRNFIDGPAALAEIGRVLRPGGRLVVLDIFSARGAGPVAGLFAFAFRAVAPVLGLVFAGDRDAYTYLPESAVGFTYDGLASDMGAAGLERIDGRRLAFGSVAILVGERPATGPA
jgi:demethylmenaquinone methyltransferase/2-methoxy-6-polyprenyl-1,4-benzoquinol methylase